MKTIVLITTTTPFKENKRGASAHPYHLMIEREKFIKIIIYSFNFNELSKQEILEVEESLNVKIKLLPKRFWFKVALNMKIFRLFLKYPIHNYLRLQTGYLKEINNINPDGIWIYGHELSRITKQFIGYKIVQTMPDSEALYYYRMIGQRFVFKNWKNLIRQYIMYPKYIRMESEYPINQDIQYHLVGKEDLYFLTNNNQKINAHFLFHPHYDLENISKNIRFTEPKIKLILAGKNDLYMKQNASELIHEMSKNTNLKEYYHFTFLGKGWEKEYMLLKQAGWEVCHINYAQNYVKELSTYDIQITPITIGTGTKGKVLDALGNGLLVIGTYYALENIDVKDRESCCLYKNISEAISILTDIPKHREKYEDIAQKGQYNVLHSHSRSSIAKDFFSLFNIKTTNPNI